MNDSAGEEHCGEVNLQNRNWMKFDFILQSQRDCILQPRVARNELPWVLVQQIFSTATRLRRLLSSGHPRISTQPRWGCNSFRGFTQGSSFLATLGYAPESRWDSGREMTLTVHELSCARSTHLCSRFTLTL
jgi:hypothetical protein